MTTVVNIRKKHDVCVMRPGKWGNPFVIGIHGDRAEVVRKHREWLPHQPELMADLPELFDKVIACCCRGKVCHAYNLADAANELQKKDLTEIPKCVNLSTPAQCDGHNLTTTIQTIMNPKLFGLLCTIAATALTQMANACGGPAEDTPTPAAKKNKAPAKVAEPEPEEEEETDVTVEVEDTEEEAPDYAAMKKKALAHVRKIYEIDDGGLKARKDKMRAMLATFKEANIGDAADKNVPGILAAVLKMK